MKSIILLILAMSILLPAEGQPSKNNLFNLVIGTYANPAKSKGIYVYEFNSKTGEFRLKSETGDVENPSFLAISSNGKYVYAANEVRDGGVSAFSFDPVSGAIKFLNRVSSGGSGPAYVSVNDRGNLVFAGNYGSGSLCAIPVNADGSLGDQEQVIQHEGGSVDKSRQKGPHVHSTVLSPDNNYLFTPDLGTDKIDIYRINSSGTGNPLTNADQPFATVKAGSGPRHMAFHPNSKYAYVIQEMAAMITVFDYKDGRLTAKQEISLLPEGYTGRKGAADIHISPDGKFLYGSDRDDLNEIVIFSIQKDGTLKLAGRQSTLGKTPRNFSIDPSGNYLIAANQNSNEVVIFKRDRKTGLLTPTGQKIEVVSPVCLKFFPVK